MEIHMRKQSFYCVRVSGPDNCPYMREIKFWYHIQFNVGQFINDLLEQSGIQRMIF